MPNPVFNEKKFEEASAGWAVATKTGTQAQPAIDGPVSSWQKSMTINGTISASVVLLILLLVAASFGWNAATGPTTVEGVNEIVMEATRGRFEGILGYTYDPIVSSDVRGTSFSGIYDSLATIVVDGTMLKSIIWFDNGWGYSVRVVETLRRIETVEVSP